MKKLILLMTILFTSIIVWCGIQKTSNTTQNSISTTTWNTIISNEEEKVESAFIISTQKLVNEDMWKTYPRQETLMGEWKLHNSFGNILLDTGVLMSYSGTTYSFFNNLFSIQIHDSMPFFSYNVSFYWIQKHEDLYTPINLPHQYFIILQATPSQLQNMSFLSIRKYPTGPIGSDDRCVLSQEDQERISWKKFENYHRSSKIIHDREISLIEKQHISTSSYGLKKLETYWNMCFEIGEYTYQIITSWLPTTTISGVLDSLNFSE